MNWMRRAEQPSAVANAFTSVVFATPGTPLEEDVPACEQRDHHHVERARRPDVRLLHFAPELFDPLLGGHDLVAGAAASRGAGDRCRHAWLSSGARRGLPLA